MAELDEKVELLRAALVQLAGAVVSLRGAVGRIAIQPNLMVPPDDRRIISDELETSGKRVGATLDLIDKILALRS